MAKSVYLVSLCCQIYQCIAIVTESSFILTFSSGDLEQTVTVNVTAHLTYLDVETIVITILALQNVGFILTPSSREREKEKERDTAR